MTGIICRLESFFDWLHTESTTRMRESRASGWRFNIVYTEEGRRRCAFLRLVFSVESVCGSEWPTQLSSYLTSFGALRVDDVVEFSQSVHPEKYDRLDNGSFWSWLCGCSCCTQRVIEAQRGRPSKFRVSFKGMLQAALISNEAARQVYRSLKESAMGWIPVRFLTKDVPFPFAHIRPLRCPGESVYFVSTWGDETLLEADQKVENLDPSQYVVSSYFRIVNGLGHRSHEQWWWEVAARFPGKHVVVTHPRSRGEFAFQIGDARTLSFLKGLKPGAAADPNCPHQQWLVQSGLWVRVDEADTKDNLEGMNTELHGKGYTVVAPHRLIPAPYWNAGRKYHRALRPWLYEFSGEGNGKGKFRTWNDEPVARHRRQIQMTLTNWATRVSRAVCGFSFVIFLILCSLAQSCLALSIFIQRGPGFIYHTDSSPAFDLTFDIVVDHQGVDPRPIFFVRRACNGQLLVERMELRCGEAVLFKGAELTHFGGDLNNPDCFHSVQLYTWQYVRD
jgi:hypothetical protein